MNHLIKNIQTVGKVLSIILLVFLIICLAATGYDIYSLMNGTTGEEIANIWVVLFRFFYYISVSCNGFFLMSAFITRNSRKTHENTKGKKAVGWAPCSTLPRPHTKSTKNNEIHEKGDRGGGLIGWLIYRPAATG